MSISPISRDTLAVFILKRQRKWRNKNKKEKKGSKQIIEFWKLPGLREIINFLFSNASFFKPNHWWRSNSPSVHLHQWPCQHRQLLRWARHRKKLFTHSDEFEFNYRSHNSLKIYILRKYQTFICVRNFDRRVAHWLVHTFVWNFANWAFNFFFPTSWVKSNSRWSDWKFKCPFNSFLSLCDLYSSKRATPRAGTIQNSNDNNKSTIFMFPTMSK